MDTTPTAAPAGDSAQPAAQPPIVDHSLEGVLAAWRKDQEQEQEQKPAEGEEPKEAEASADEPGDEPEPTAGDADAPEGDEPAEPEADDKPADFIPGNALTRMQDGSVRPVGELKKAWGELQELKKAQPEIVTARQELERERAAIQQRAQQVDQLFQTISTLEGGMPRPPDRSLRETDPVEYTVQKDRYEEARERLWTVHAQREQAQQQQFQSYVRGEQAKLLERRPDLRDPEKARDAHRVIAEWGKEHGFSDDEINTVYDHRLVHGILATAEKNREVAEKAAKWDKLQADKAKATKKAEGASPVAAPGRRLTPGENRDSQVDALRKRAMASGSIDDVLAYHRALEPG